MGKAVCVCVGGGGGSQDLYLQRLEVFEVVYGGQVVIWSNPPLIQMQVLKVVEQQQAVQQRLLQPEL
jgi:hypothetical protein